MRAHFVAAVLIATAPIAACGGSDKTAAPKATVAATAPADVSTATAEVKKNWSDFFGTKVAFAQKPALLEDGDLLGAALALAAKSPVAAHTVSTVTAVTFTSPDKANITYDLYVLGNKVLTGADGYAVLQGGTWKVSKFTFCNWQKLGTSGKPVPGCS
jgi:hypothetical protein